jgi:bifunctional DNA-binding transcriptional regulator/antitoxin component of YhaV-PrlF toxin-antitoxin module
MHTVGPKGQVVIEKEIRDELGVGPGWSTIQRVIDGHVEIYFVPPEHNRSLKGVLSGSSRSIAREDWPAARDAAWEAAMRDKMSDRSGE